MRVLIYLGVEGWLIGLAAAVAVVTCVRRRDVGLGLLAMAVVAWFTSRLVASWLLVHPSEIMTPPTLTMRVAGITQTWIAPLCLVAGFPVLGAKGSRAAVR